MTYPAGIEALTVKTDGPDQVIAAAHPNALKTAFDEFRAVIGDAPQGAVADLQTRLATLIGTDAKLSNFGKIRVVGKDGCKYSTIQSAIDSITDASNSNPYAVFVLPGVYVEKVTTKNYVSVLGFSVLNSIYTPDTYYPVCKIVAPSGQNAVSLVSSQFAGFYIESSQTPSAVVATSGVCIMDRCFIYSGGEDGCVSRSSGDLFATHCKIHSDMCAPVQCVGGYMIFRYSTLAATEGCNLLALSSSAKILFSHSYVYSSDGTIESPAGCLVAARLCELYPSLSGAGTKDTGTMTGSNSDPLPALES